MISSRKIIGLNRQQVLLAEKDNLVQDYESNNSVIKENYPDLKMFSRLILMMDQGILEK